MLQWAMVVGAWCEYDPCECFAQELLPVRLALRLGSPSRRETRKIFVSPQFFIFVHKKHQHMR